MINRRLTTRLGSALAVFAGLTILPGGATTAGATTAAAGTTTLSAQTAYNCEVNTPPPPPEDYSGSVTVNIQFTAPSSVYPGETINLTGTMTLQFPENLRAAAIAYGDNSVQGVSTTINVGVDAAGQSTDVFADEWQTPPTEIGNPMEVSGVLTMPPLTVPKNATGVYELQMPENGATPNTAESSPAEVAFTATATASGSNGQTPIKLACYLPGSSPELGQIPIVAAPAAATKTTPAKTTASKPTTVAKAKPSGTTKSSGATQRAATTKAAGTTAASHATKTTAATAASGATKAATTTPAAQTPGASAATPAASPASSSGSGHTSSSGAAGNATGSAAASAGTASAGASGTAAATPSASSPGAAVAGTGSATPATSGNTGAVAASDGAVDAVGSPASSSTSTRSGVYVSTLLLVLGGVLICLASVGYGLLANYRLRGIRRELDD